MQSETPIQCPDCGETVEPAREAQLREDCARWGDTVPAKAVCSACYQLRVEDADKADFLRRNEESARREEVAAPKLMTRRCMDCESQVMVPGPRITTTGLCDACLPARLASVRELTATKAAP